MQPKGHRPSTGSVLTRWVLPVAVVFVVALSVKLLYLQERLALPDAGHPTLDSLFHDQWARGLAFHEWTPDQQRMQHEPYFRAPLYAYFVAGVYRVAGTEPRTLFTLQVVIGALTVVLMFVFCALAFGRRIAWVAAALHLGYWPFTYHESERLIPVLSLSLDLLFMLLVLRAGRSGRLRTTVAAGAAAGLSAIARPSILIVLPVAVVWLARRVRAAKWKHAGVLVAAVAVVILPVTLRNLVRGHDLVAIASQGGVNFYIGNNPGSNGITAVVPGTRADWWGGYDDARRIAERDAGRPLKPSEVSRYWFRRGLRFLADEPLAAARLYARKAALFLGSAEPSNERQLYFRRQHSRVLPQLFVSFGLLLATAAIGALELRRRRSAAGGPERSLSLLFAVTYAIGVVLFFVTSRFRLPVAMFLIPVSAAGCVALFDVVRARAWPQAGRDAAIAGTVLVLTALNPYGVGSLSDSRGEYGLGVDYFRDGEYQKALDAFDRSLAADSAYAPAWKMRGWVHERAGNLEAALHDLETACRLDSTEADAFFRLGVVLQKAGRHEQAEREYLRAIELDPTRVEALNNLADVYLRLHRSDDALPYLRRALDADPNFVNSIYGMGYYYELKGDTDRAAALYRRAIDYPPARARLSRIEQRGGG